MPTKHIVKTYAAPAFYHVYNRASGERQLFRDKQDREFFLILLQKYLVENAQAEDDTKSYAVEIVAYCLMGSHFHLLLFQEEDTEAISGYMKSVSTSYSMYYNKKYKSKGHVFQSNYRASHITDEPYLAHITRYIHLNPRRYTTWQWSSYKNFIQDRSTDWIHPERVLEKGGNEKYKEFVEDYAHTDRRLQYTELSKHLAI